MALHLNGSSDWVDLGSSALLNPASFSFSGWLKPLSLANSYSGILTRFNASSYYQFFLKSSGAFAFYMATGSSDPVAGATLSIGNWYHVVFALGNTNLTIYVNGASIYSNSISNLSPGFVADTALGQDTNTAGRFFNGDIADAAFYNTALTANDAAQLYAGISPLAIEPANLVGYWPLPGGAQGGLDRGPNGLLAVLNGTSGANDPPFLIPYRKRILSYNSAPRLNPNSIFPFGEWEMPALLAAAGVPTGAWASVEAADVAAFNGTAAVTGTLASTETADSAVFNGNTIVSGALAVTEAPDIAAFSGNAGVSGSLSTTEAQDVASFAGSGIVSGTLAATDTPDTAVLSGNAGTSGSLSATTAQDVASFAGNFGVTGTWVSTEASDLAVFVGQFGIASGTLAANDNADIAAFTGSATGAPSGSLNVTELPDNVVFLIDYKAPPSVTAASPYPSPFDYGWSYGEPPVRPGMPGSGVGRSS